MEKKPSKRSSSFIGDGISDNSANRPTGDVVEKQKKRFHLSQKIN